MAILKFKDIGKMNEKEKADKIKELKLELVRANVTANRANAKTKEIKKAISRLITFNKLHKGKLKNK
ncbi:hypothetical protein HYV50_05940 [Candidatus Pacearchaeota archaeon]|nr:hypothetical protein [Candidatus Pacearchaeota archaeon]